MTDYDKNTLYIILFAIFNLFAATLNVIVMVNEPNPVTFVCILASSIIAGWLIGLAISRHN